MKVLLTGAFGNIGSSALPALLERGHRVRCFDLWTKASERIAQCFAGQQIEVWWGDIRRPESVADAVQDQDVVVHLAFIIPKLSLTRIESELRPDLAREVNLGGTTNVVSAIRALRAPPRLVFTSTLHVYGKTQDRDPPRRITDPVEPTDHYSEQKIECEHIVRSSGLEWTILRLAAALPLALRLDPGMFDVPLSNRMEFVHTRDVGVAIAHAVTSPEVWARTWHIGGGKRCQLHYWEYMKHLLGAMGIGMLPPKAFSTEPYPTDWLDTEESERVLRYQQRDLTDYAREMVTMLGYRTRLIRLFKPLVRSWLLTKSPYWTS